MPSEFKHVAQELAKPKPLVYTAMSKHLFYYRMHISKFVIEQGSVPLNAFMVFDYFLLDTVDRYFAVATTADQVAMEPDVAKYKRLL